METGHNSSSNSNESRSEENEFEDHDDLSVNILSDSQDTEWYFSYYY